MTTPEKSSMTEDDWRELEEEFEAELNEYMEEWGASLEDAAQKETPD